MRVRLVANIAEPLSLGTLRTALANWLFARHSSGTVLFCTSSQQASTARSTPTYDGLCWLGLDWDAETDRNGAYTLSEWKEYLARYRCYAFQLVEEQKAYLSTPSPGGAASSTTLSPVVRLKVPRPGKTSVPDLIFRECVFEHATLDDPVLLQSNGSPTALMASVADDHEMAITHIIRGYQDLSRTSYEYLLYQALGWDAPAYAHLPPVEPGAAIGGLVAAFREQGYMPLAVANHLALLGWNRRGKRRLLSLLELAQEFDLGRVSRNPVAFDLERLHWFNRHCLARTDPRELVPLLVSRWEKAYGASHRAQGTELSPAQWKETLVTAIREELDCLGQVPERVRFVFADQVEPDTDAAHMLAQPFATSVLQAFVQELRALPSFDYETLDTLVSRLRLEYKERLGIRSRDVMFVLRAALTGQLGGPCLIVACQLLGQQRCIQRAQQVILQSKR